MFGEDHKDGFEARGPPVELEAPERGYAKDLARWWISLSVEVREEIEEDVSVAKRPGKAASPSSARKSPAQRHVLRDGASYADTGDRAGHELRNGVTYSDK